jgi:hypothetical protein
MNTLFRVASLLGASGASVSACKNSLRAGNLQGIFDGVFGGSAKKSAQEADRDRKA